MHLTECRIKKIENHSPSDLVGRTEKDEIHCGRKITAGFKVSTRILVEIDAFPPPPPPPPPPYP